MMKAVVAFSLCVVTVFGQCSWKNVALLATDNTTVVTGTKNDAACQDLCKKGDCKFWSYIWNDEICHLFPTEAVSMSFFQQNTVSGPKECCEEKTCDAASKFINSDVENLDECRGLCLAHANCLKHSFADGQCTLKLQGSGPATTNKRCCENCPEPVISSCIEPLIAYSSTTNDTTVTASSFADCVRQCREMDGCSAVTYQYDGQCFLKTSDTPQVSREACGDCISVRMDCCAQKGMKVEGSPYITLVDIHDKQECEKECLLRDLCLGFTYNTERRTCSMIKGEIAHVESDDSDDVTGQRFCCDDDGLTFDGSEINTTDARSVYECRVECQKANGCEKFTFTKDGKCNMYSKDANVTLLPSVSDGVSGPVMCWREEGISWIIDNIDSFKMDSAENCRLACGKEINCTNWVFRAKECFLKVTSGPRYNYWRGAITSFKGY